MFKIKTHNAYIIMKIYKESYIKSIKDYVDSSIDKERIYARWKQSGDNHNVALTVEIK